MSKSSNKLGLHLENTTFPSAGLSDYENRKTSPWKTDSPKRPTAINQQLVQSHMIKTSTLNVNILSRPGKIKFLVMGIILYYLSYSLFF